MPQQLSDALSIPLIASEFLLSFLTLLGIALPLALVKASGLIVLIVGLPTMGFLIAINWLPIWILLLLALIVALFYADEIKGMM